MFPRLTVPVLLSLLLGCPSTQPDPDPDPTPEPTPAPWQPPPAAACGMEPYELIEPGAVEVLALEEAPDWTIPGGTVDFVLAGGGVDLPANASHDVASWRIRYTTQDRGQPAQATALVALPAGDGADAETSWPVLVVEHGFTGITPACSASEDAGWPLLSAFFASRGYAVVAPDYLGLVGVGDLEGTPPHGALVMEQTAIATWDAVRALRSLVEGPLAFDLPGGLDDGVLLWGASQGGHAVLASARWQPWMAEEETLLGVVSAVPPLDLTGAVRDAMTELGGGTALALQALVSMQRWYGQPADLRELLTDEAPGWYATQVEDWLEQTDTCGGNLDEGPDTLEDIFQPDALAGLQGLEPEAAQPFTCYLEENSLPTTSVPPRADAPTLFVFAELDDVVLPETQLDDVQDLCDADAPIEVFTCAGADHVQGPLWSLPEQLAWMEARVAGEPLGGADPCADLTPLTCSGTPEGR